MQLLRNYQHRLLRISPQWDDKWNFYYHYYGDQQPWCCYIAKVAHASRKTKKKVSMQGCLVNYIR